MTKTQAFTRVGAQFEADYEAVKPYAQYIDWIVERLQAILPGCEIIPDFSFTAPDATLHIAVSNNAMVESVEMSISLDLQRIPELSYRKEVISSIMKTWVDLRLGEAD